MTKSLSKEEVEKLVKEILPTITKALEEGDKARIYMSDITKTTSTAKREGNTPDVYCKIAEAMFSRGIAIDLGVHEINHRAVFGFRKLRKGEDAPTLTRCKFEWEIANELPPRSE
jgi:hypothetical protein